MAFEAPYYRRHLENKQYTKLLAIPGRVAQASEFSDIQDMLSSQIKSVGNAIMNEGNIVSGCQIIFSEEDSKKFVTITDGKIYLDGFVRDLYQPEKPIEITGKGTENICVVLKESVISENEDADLYDPSLSGIYQQEGCHAVKYEVVVQKDVEGAPILYKLTDGQLPNSQQATNEYAPIVEIMARRTYDESGNYRVSGLDLRDRHSSDDRNIYLDCTYGKAYIRGFEISVPVDKKFAVRKAEDTDTAEWSFAYQGSTFFNNILPATPVASINYMTATFEVTNDAVTRANTGLEDVLYDPEAFKSRRGALKAVLVTQDDVIFPENNYKIINNYIQWNNITSEDIANKKAPAKGSTYKVVYIVRAEIPLTQITITDSLKGSIQISSIYDGAEGNNRGVLFTDNEISVSYQYALSRHDLVSLDLNGNIVVSEGEPNIDSLCLYPKIDDPNSLILGVVKVHAGSDTPEIIGKTIDVVNMSRLNNMLLRLQEMEYNSAVEDLDNEAAEGEPATELSGVFTDGFLGYTKVDLGADELDCCIDDREGVLTNGFTVDTVDYDYTKSSSGYKVPSISTTYPNILMGTCFTIPYKEVLGLTQPLATTSLLVNPYSVFDPLCPLTIIPAVDNWVDNSYVEVTNPAKTVTQRVSVGSTRDWYASYGTNALKNFFGDLSNVVADRGAKSLAADASWSQTTYTTSVSEKDTKMAYMRQKEVDFECVGFESNADNISLTFDHEPIMVTPRGTSKAGSITGTLRADGTGKVMGTFVVPPNTLCGTKEVGIYYQGNAVSGGYEKSGSATYTANGTLHTVTTSITPVRKIFKVHDPLAESFGFDQERFVTSVDIYFSYFDSDYPVVVQIRNIENGYPGTECYGEAILTEASYSDDASVKTNAKFTNPVRCLANTQYCFVVMTDSNKTACWVAKLAENKLGTKTPVTANPYSEGVLFTSSNNLTWTAQQDADLKFNINVAEFSAYSNYELVYPTTTVTDGFTSFIFNPAYITPLNTSCVWKYCLNPSTTTKDTDWVQCDTLVEIPLSTKETLIQFKAIMRTDNPFVSPLISVNNANFTWLLNKSEATYISRSVTVVDGFNDLKLYLDIASGLSDTSYKVWYETRNTDAASWTRTNLSLTSPTTTPTVLDNVYKRYYWNNHLSTETTRFRVGIELSTNNVAVLPKVKRLMCILKDI